VTALVDLVLGAGSVDIDDRGAVAPRVVCEVPLAAAAFGDGHRKVQLVEDRAGADPIGRDEPDQVAPLVALETSTLRKPPGSSQ
jgi:hypothetical protein